MVHTPSLVPVVVAGIIVVIMIALGLFFSLRLLRRKGVHGVGVHGVKEAMYLTTREQELVNYIKGARAAGLDDSVITRNLEHVGWQPEKIQQAFKQA